MKNVIAHIYHIKKSVTCNKSVVFSGYSGFLHQWNWPPWYNLNIVESGIKHHKPNSSHIKYSWHRVTCLRLVTGFLQISHAVTYQYRKTSEICDFNQITYLAILLIFFAQKSTFWRDTLKYWLKEWRHHAFLRIVVYVKISF